MNYTKVEKYIISLLESELPENCLFHNWQHTADVIKYAEQIAMHLEVARDDLILLKTAALFHDTGFIQEYENNESLGADFAAKMLPQYGYSPEQIAVICSLIKSTSFPRHPQTLMEKILCDADLFYITTESFYDGAANLRQELEFYGVGYSNYEWYVFESNFLKTHHFFTDYCETRFQQVLPQILAKLGEKFNKSGQS